MSEADDTVAIQPTSKDLGLLSRPLARPWPRYWARLFDLTWLSIALGLIVYWIIPDIFGEHAVVDPSYDKFLSLALFPVVLLLGALVQFIFGNTPGKLMAGIRVETTRSGRLSLGQSIKRSLSVWVKGLGLGLPIVVLFAMIACYMTVKAGRLTSWDAKNDTRVFDRHSNIYRTLLTFAVTLALAGGLAALNIMSVQGTAVRHSPAEIAKANEGLPRQIDDVTRMDRIEVVDGVVTYSYTLVNSQGAPSLSPMQVRNMKAGAPGLVLPIYCRGSTDSPQPFPTYPVRYLYRTFEGKVAVDFTFRPEDCTSSAP
jgi:uncharacterized RDD family membrane protein YckC